MGSHTEPVQRLRGKVRGTLCSMVKVKSKDCVEDLAVLRREPEKHSLGSSLIDVGCIKSRGGPHTVAS